MSKELINSVIEALSVLTVIGDGIIILLLFLLFLSLFFQRIKAIIGFIADNYLVASFLVALTATFGSLFLSEIAKFTPCRLCWFQRIFMYPQSILLAVALATDDKTVRKYTIPLSIIGALIAAYHYYIQMFPASSTCSATEVSCANKYTVYFGYITIPMMALTAFLLIFLFSLVRGNKTRQTKTQDYLKSQKSKLKSTS